MKGVAFTVYGMKIEATLTDLGGGRCRINSFYVDGKRTVPHSHFREETFKQLAAALEREHGGKYELVNIWPAISPERK
jgi:hypothetical protein